MTPSFVLGIDGGLAHLGWCVAACAPGKKPHVVDGGVIETLKRSIGTSAESHTVRALELHRQLDDVVAKYAPISIVAEAFSPPRDSRNAAMLAWSWGVICAIASWYSLPIAAKSPMPLKRAFTGDQTAKKPAMIEAALEQYPESRPLFDALTRDHHEHLADSIAAVHYFHSGKVA